MPSNFVATVISVSKNPSDYGSNLKLELLDERNGTFSVSYRIPKALSGKGQLDKLLNSLENLGVNLENIVGKKFEWQRMELEGSIKGNPRHYPVRLVKL
jgi:hypothetical protein